MDFKTTAGWALLVVGGLDLAFGTQPQITIPGTDIAIFPAPLSNILTQQMDLLLVAAGVALVWVL